MDDLWYIDADSHVEEGPAVWEYLDARYRGRKPQVIAVAYEGPQRKRDRAWLIDGRIFPHPYGHGPVNFSTPPTMTWASSKPVSVESQMMVPAAARLIDMDRLRIGAQVNFPTIFLEHLSSDRSFEAALMRAWNRWIADASRDHAGRLKWGALIPFWDTRAAVAELHWAKEHGAAGVYTLGTVYDTFLNDAMFDSVYATCEDLDLPVCVHIGWAHQGLNRSCDSMLASIMFTFEQSLLHGFYAFVAGGVLERFTKLRVVFLEGDIRSYLQALERMDTWGPLNTAQSRVMRTRPRDLIEQGRVYFSCEGNEESLPSFVRAMGGSQVLLGADFPHVHFQGDTLCGGLGELARRDDLDAELKRRIAYENASHFYNFAAAPPLEAVDASR